jgi:hypothetical protein
MPSDQPYPYATHLDIKYPPLEVVDVPALIDAVRDRWYNQTLCKVNDSVVRLGVMQGEYHWHKHDDLEEFFYVVEGEFLIDLEDRTVALKPRQGFVVPKGVVHRTRARASLPSAQCRRLRPSGSRFSAAPSLKSCSRTMLAGSTTLSCTVFFPAIPTLAVICAPRVNPQIR